MKNKLMSRIILLALTVSVVFLSSCKKYLDEKSDKKLVVPSTLEDAQALLDYYDNFCTFYPNIGNMGDDNFYLKESYYNSLALVNRNNYVWAKEAVNDIDWSYLYQKILAATIALETAERIQPTPLQVAKWENVKGTALFYRAWALYHVAEYYAVPYEKTSAINKPGIPLRLTSNVNEVTERGNLEASWQEIIKELKMATVLLPALNSPVSRPSKAAAFALLAKAYLDMEAYELAGAAADSSLKLYNTLIDFNTLNAAAANPFARFNAEVLFPSIILGTGSLAATNYMLDSLLYASYHANDLRRTVYFQSNGTGTYGFRASYDGNTGSNQFNGIATDEIYLVRAECSARKGLKDSAMNDLNTLLKKRWKTGTFVAYTAANAEDALMKVLAERRKELILRGTRWFDLRRLNKDPRFAKTLVRKIGVTIYQLPPGDSRYTFLIPQTVINMTGIEQNTR